MKTETDIQCESIIERTIRLAGGISVVARHFHIRPWAVGKWVKEGKVPSDRVPGLIILSGFAAFPHQLNADLPVLDNGQCPYCHKTHKEAA